MPHRIEASLIEQAVDWHLRLKDADADDWTEFTTWLEADPAHDAAYETVLNEEERLTPYLREATYPSAAADSAEESATEEEQAPQQATDPGRMSRFAASWRWGAVAASVALAVTLGWQVLPGGDSAYTVETVPGEMRKIALADGSEIALNGGTQIELDRENERMARLVSGEARFAIKHDDSAPFMVRSGDSRLVDIGTVFNVVSAGGELEVAVAEGAVRYEGPERQVRLDAGQALTAGPGGTVAVTRQSPDAVGSWARGMLIYQDAALSDVAADLSRSIGVAITVAPEIGGQRFSGVIQTGGGTDAVRQRLEPLLGVTVEANGARWTIRR